MSQAVTRTDFILGAVLFAVGLYMNTMVPGSGVNLMMAGAGLMIGAILAQDPEEIILASSRSVSGRDQIAPWRIIYGEPRIGGVITYMGLSGSRSTYLDIVLTLSGHEVEAINDLYLDDALVPISGIDATGKYAGNVWLEKNLGTINQTVFTNLQARSAPQWQTKGIRFNGAGHYGNTVANTDLGPATMTMEVLFRPRDVSPGVIVTYGGAAGWTLEWQNNRRVRFTDASGGTLQGSSALQLNQAYQITVIAQGSGLTMKRNGSSHGSNGTAYDDGTGSRTLYVGSLDGDTEFFKGDIDLLRVFNDVRTTPEIIDNLGIPVTPDASVVGNWDFDEGSGLTIDDNSSPNNDITLVENWTVNHIQSGRANVYLRLKWSQALFPNGLPNIAFDVQGKKVLDPRTAQVVESIDVGADTITLMGHGKSDGDAIRVTRDVSLPAPLVEDTTYWIVSSTTDTFKLAAEPGGAAISLTESLVTVLDLQIDVSEDDGLASDGTTWGVTATNHGAGDSGGNPIIATSRFPNAGIPNGQEFLVAHMVFTARSTNNSQTIATKIQAHLSANSAQISDRATFDAIEASELTIASVPWVPGAWTQHVEEQTPSLIGPVEEVVALPEWGIGSALHLFWLDDGSVTNVFRFSHAWDSDPDRAVVFHCEFIKGVMRIMDVEWSENPTLCALDYLMDPEYGLRVPLLDVGEASINAAANVCEEQVPRETEPDENRYDCDGVVLASRTPQNNMERLLTAMGGQMTYVGGKWALYAAAFRTTSLDLSEDDIISPIKVRTLIGRADNFNTVKGLYLDPLNNWEPTDYPEVTDASFVTADGEVVYKDFGLEFTRSVTATQRLAKIFLLKIRNPITVAFTTKLVGYQLQPPNTMRLTNSRLGWTNKEFEVSESQLVIEPDSEGAPVLGQRLTLRETGSSIYTWASSEEGDIPGIPKTGLPDPFASFPPDDIIVESGTAQLDIRLDGTIFSRIKVSWTQAEDEFVLEGGHIDVQYRKSADVPWNPTGYIPGDETFVFVLDVEDGILYDVRIRSVNSLGVPSEWVQFDDHTVIGKTAPPEDVTGFLAQQNGELVTFLWNNVSDLDLRGYEIRFGKITHLWDDCTKLVEAIKTDKVTDALVPPGAIDAEGNRQPWLFLIKAIDTSGNYSVSAATFELLVTPTFDILFEINQWPNWPGIITDMIRDPKTGFLNVEDQTASNLDNYDLFDNYVVSAPTSYQYETPVLDIGYDDPVKAWADINGHLGNQLSGILIPQVQLDYRLDADAFDGFEDWVIGQVIARHFKFRFEQQVSDGVYAIEDFITYVDIVEHVNAEAIVVPIGGLKVTFDYVYRLIPDVVVIPPTGLFVSFFAITKTSFSVYFLDGGGNDVGGTGSYTATGV